MVTTDATTLTERQVEVLTLRKDGYTQQEVADRLGTTDANISAIERAAEQNVEKARRTLELVRTLDAPVRFTVESGTPFDELIETIYRRADETGTKIDSCRPDLYTDLYESMDEHLDQNQVVDAVEIGITPDGDITVFPASEG